MKIIWIKSHNRIKQPKIDLVLHEKYQLLQIKRALPAVDWKNKGGCLLKLSLQRIRCKMKW